MDIKILTKSRLNLDECNQSGAIKALAKLVEVSCKFNILEAPD